MTGSTSWRYEISLAREAVHRSIGELETVQKRLVEAQATGHEDTAQERAEFARIIRRIEEINRRLALRMAI